MNIIEQYSEFLGFERRLKAKSVGEYVNYLTIFFSRCTNPLEVKHRSEIIKVIKDIETERNWEPMTSWRFSFCIKKFYDWLLMEGKIPFNPYPFNMFRKPRPKQPKFLRQKDFDFMTERDIHLTHQDKLIINTLWDTAVRREEMVSIDQCDIDLKNRMLEIPPHKSKGGYGGRFISFSDKTAELLERQFHILGKTGITTFVFANESFKRMAPNDVTKRIVHIGKVLDPSGYLKLTPHMFRHSLGIRLLEAGASPLEIQKILGHTNESMTNLYTHSVESFAKSIRDKYLQTA